MAHFKNYLILLALVIYNAYMFNNVSAEVQNCNEILLNDETIKAYADYKFKYLWKYANSLPISYFEDTNDLHEMVHRYFKYLQSYTKYNDKILMPSDWCKKVKLLCLEPLRMAGFKMELFVPKKDSTAAFYHNWNIANAICREGIKQTGIIGDFAFYVQSSDLSGIQMFKSTGDWCYYRCAGNMQNHGFGTDVYVSLKPMIKKLKKNEIEKFTGCAKAFTQYYLSESNNIGNCFGCNEVIPSTIDHWCNYQCI